MSLQFTVPLFISASFYYIVLFTVHSRPSFVFLICLWTGLLTTVQLDRPVRIKVEQMTNDRIIIRFIVNQYPLLFSPPPSACWSCCTVWAEPAAGPGPLWRCPPTRRTSSSLWASSSSPTPRRSSSLLWRAAWRTEGSLTPCWGGLMVPPASWKQCFPYWLATQEVSSNFSDMCEEFKKLFSH